jgi:hypothetical protein
MRKAPFTPERVWRAVRQVEAEAVEAEATGAAGPGAGGGASTPSGIPDWWTVTERST